MQLTFLGPLYARQGPYACAYVDTSRDLDDPDRAIDLRRRHLQAELAAQGADMATTSTVTRLVGTDRDLPGQHGQAIFAAHGRLALAEELPEPPARDTARYTMLPDAMPLAMQHAPDIPYVAAAVHRVAQPQTTPGEAEFEVDLQAGRWPSTRVAPEDRTRRRVPADNWRQTAAEVAVQLADLADHSGAEAIVLSGDHWARNTLARELPKRLRQRLVGIDSDGWDAEPERALLEDELDHLFHGRLSARDHASVERFLARRARHSGATEGLADTVAALRRGQAEAVLINDPFDLHQRLWVGLTPKQIGLTQGELRYLGVESSWEEPADAALIRTIVGTGAELIVIPREELPLHDGLGALLRYPDATT
ncbi:MULTISPECIES: baeRF2 domain-containing protein [Kitasatospora]|uniref:Peptide chain release factor 1 n=1 Tax=Kitasatospora cystarginea TaxID=58350 RepID=A0ABN3DZG5_9ACTN